MKELITPNWRASKKTINTLIAAGWSDEQRKRMLIAFINEHGGKKIENASSLYNTMVRFETPRNAPQKPDDTKQLINDRATDLKNKSKDGKQRSREAKQQAKVMSQAEVEAYYNGRKLVQ